MPARAVAWLTLASPKVATAIESSGRPVSIPSLAAREKEKAVPIAFGRWLAIVLVWGGTHAAFEPQTLWRPPLTGSSAEAVNERSVSKSGVLPSSLRMRAAMKPPER